MKLGLILASTVLLTASHAALAQTATFPSTLVTNTTPAPDSTVLGAPDNVTVGLGTGGIVTFDLGSFRLIDGAGQDFNVFETAVGNGNEFVFLDVLVSNDNVTFFNIDASNGDLIAFTNVMVGGNNNANVRSFDIGAAVLAGFNDIRFISLVGTAGGAPGAFNGFDLDAIGIRSSALVPAGGGMSGAVPEPATWAMMLIGFGAVGASVRRKRRAALTQAA